MAGKKKIVDVPDELVPVSKQAINVTATLKEVAIPKGTVYYTSVDDKGNPFEAFVNIAGLQTIKQHQEAKGLPFEYDESRLTMPKPIGFRVPFGNGNGGCKNC